MLYENHGLQHKSLHSPRLHLASSLQFFLTAPFSYNWVSFQLVSGVYFHVIQNRLQEFLSKRSFCFFSLAFSSQLWGHYALFYLSYCSCFDTASLHTSERGQIRCMLARWALTYLMHFPGEGTSLTSFSHSTWHTPHTLTAHHLQSMPCS